MQGVDNLRNAIQEVEKLKANILTGILDADTDVFAREDELTREEDFYELALQEARDAYDNAVAKAEAQYFSVKHRLESEINEAEALIRYGEALVSNLDNLFKETIINKILNWIKT